MKKAHRKGTARKKRRERELRREQIAQRLSARKSAKA